MVNERWILNTDRRWRCWCWVTVKQKRWSRDGNLRKDRVWFCNCRIRCATGADHKRWSCDGNLRHRVCICNRGIRRATRADHRERYVTIKYGEGSNQCKYHTTRPRCSLCSRCNVNLGIRPWVHIDRQWWGRPGFLKKRIKFLLERSNEFDYGIVHRHDDDDGSQLEGERCRPFNVAVRVCPFPRLRRGQPYLDHCSTELSIYVVEIIGPFLCAED